MWFTRDIIVVIVVLIGFVTLSNGIKYRGIPEDEEIFSDCPNQPKSVLNINGLFDLSYANFLVELDKIVISGNATLVWNIKTTDRVQLHSQLLKFNRGVWEPTVFNIKVPNFCPVMFDKNQYWYNAFFKHVTNFNEVQNKCLTAGTTQIYEPFDIYITYESMANMDGRCKLVLKFKAFDSLNRERPTSICFEIKGESIRI